jgi:hypothetical protein
MITSLYLQVSEWVIAALHQLCNYSSISWREQVNFQWDNDDVRFDLNQHAELDFIVLAHWNTLGHIILIPRQPVSYSLMLRV